MKNPAILAILIALASHYSLAANSLVKCTGKLEILPLMSTLIRQEARPILKSDISKITILTKDKSVVLIPDQFPPGVAILAPGSSKISSATLNLRDGRTLILKYNSSPYWKDTRTISYLSGNLEKTAAFYGPITREIEIDFVVFRDGLPPLQLSKLGKVIEIKSGHSATFRLDDPIADSSAHINLSANFVSSVDFQINSGDHFIYEIRSNSVLGPPDGNKPARLAKPD